ncbi:hypothetical protein CLOP_g2560 [Closterium sp. NIES-67]|nr:hypothetical protein CLOP_g2560 [Closterium sp. NIES-67]
MASDDGMEVGFAAENKDLRIESEQSSTWSNDSSTADDASSACSHNTSTWSNESSTAEDSIMTLLSNSSSSFGDVICSSNILTEVTSAFNSNCSCDLSSDFNSPGFNGVSSSALTADAAAVVESASTTRLLVAAQSSVTKVSLASLRLLPSRIPKPGSTRAPDVKAAPVEKHALKTSAAFECGQEDAAQRQQGRVGLKCVVRKGPVRLTRSPSPAIRPPWRP